MATLDSSSSIRSTVGYDCPPLALMDTAEQDDVTFPPYDIEKLDEDHYCIVMALPGFGADDLDVVVEPNRLVIRGKAKDRPEKSLPRRGITRRAFVKHFMLADFIAVNAASLSDDLLIIKLKHDLSNGLKPRKIGIQTGTSRRSREPKFIDQPVT